MKILDESYYDDLLKDLEEIFREQQKDVIAVICARLRAVGKLNPTSAKQMARMAKYQNADIKEIEKVIKKTSRMAEKEIDAIFEQAAESSREYAEVLAHAATGGSYEANLQMLVSAAAREYKDMVLNLSETYAFKTDGKVLNIRQQYIKAVNKAVSAVSTGTFDYNTAIRQTVKQMVDSGLRTRQRTGEKVVEWESGYTRRVDSSVRMNVLEGVRRMNQAILDDAAEKYATGYEISAHDRPAPDHADIQGRQYTRADFENLNASLVRPIGTLNCMHIAYPIIYGVTKPTYTDAQLAAMKDNAQREYTWKGKKLTGYECTQMQRKYETAIRRAKEQDVAFRQVGNDLDAKRARKRARELTEEYRSFNDRVGLSPKLDRTVQEGYNKPITTQSTLQVPAALGGGVVPSGVALTKVRIIAGKGSKTGIRDVAYLANAYGGRPEEWVKLGGLIKTENFQYDIHWYACDGKQYEMKLKGKKGVKSGGKG